MPVNGRTGGLLDLRYIGIKSSLYPCLISQLHQAGQDDRLYDVLEEIPGVCKKFGYMPLVTPTSQIAGTQTVMNVIAGERYKLVPKESKALLKGEYGKLPGPIDRSFSAWTAQLFLEIRQDSCVKPACQSKKSLAIGHAPMFQTGPKPGGPY